MFYLSIFSILFSYIKKKSQKSFYIFPCLFFFLSFPFSISLFPSLSSSSHPSIKMYRYFFSLLSQHEHQNLTSYFFSPGLKTTTGSTRVVYFFVLSLSPLFSPILYDRSHIIIHVLSLSLPSLPSVLENK